MSFFYADGGGGQAIRLACSYVDPDQVAEGVRRLVRPGRRPPCYRGAGPLAQQVRLATRTRCGAASRGLVAIAAPPASRAPAMAKKPWIMPS